MRSEGERARLFLRDEELVTEDNAAERLDVTDWERDLWEALVGMVFRLVAGGVDEGAYMLTVPYGTLGTGGGGEGVA